MARSRNHNKISWVIRARHPRHGRTQPCGYAANALWAMMWWHCATAGEYETPPQFLDLETLGIVATAMPTFTAAPAAATARSMFRICSGVRPGMPDPRVPVPPGANPPGALAITPLPHLPLRSIWLDGSCHKIRVQYQFGCLSRRESRTTI
jgi:hypothetical protein